MEASHKSLVCLVHSLRGQMITVELRNETAVEGKVEWVDDKMNIAMTRAKLFSHDGSVRLFDSFFLAGRLVRYVHIPDQLDPLELLKRQLSQKGAERRKTKFFDQNKKKSVRLAEILAKRK